MERTAQSIPSRALCDDAGLSKMEGTVITRGISGSNRRTHCIQFIDDLYYSRPLVAMLGKSTVEGIPIPQDFSCNRRVQSRAIN